MDTYAERLTYAIKLAKSNQSKVAEAIGIKPQSVRYLCLHGRGSGHTNAIARFLGVSAIWLEQGVGSPTDIRENTAIYTNEPTRPAEKRLAPVISWQSAGVWGSQHGYFNPDDAISWMPCIEVCSERTYVLVVSGDAMASPYPGGKSYPSGSYIYVDPQRIPMPGNSVIVKFPESDQAVLRQYREDAGKVYLLSLNPQYPTYELTAGAIICGVVIAQYIPE
jgi:SOS-response transcriptional repressor LexA